MPLEQVFLLQATAPQKQVLRNLLLESSMFDSLLSQSRNAVWEVGPGPPLPWRFAKVTVVVAKGFISRNGSVCSSPPSGSPCRGHRHLDRCRSKAPTQGRVLLPRQGVGTPAAGILPTQSQAPLRPLLSSQEGVWPGTDMCLEEPVGSMPPRVVFRNEPLQLR